MDARLVAALVSGVTLSLLLPFVAFALLRSLTRVSVTDAAAVAGHYGSISIGTFVAATSLLTGRGIPAESYMVAVAAAMEAPAILSALWLAARRGGGGERVPAPIDLARIKNLTSMAVSVLARSPRKDRT